MVRSTRLELPRVAPQRPQRCASTNSATTARGEARGLAEGLRFVKLRLDAAAAAPFWSSDGCRSPPYRCPRRSRGIGRRDAEGPVFARLKARISAAGGLVDRNPPDGHGGAQRPVLARCDAGYRQRGP